MAANDNHALDMTTTEHAPAILAAHRISKSFGNNQVLFDVDLELRAGEVHALLGENGAGKSTLVKILSGFLAQSDGDTLVDGEQQHFKSCADAEALGVVLTHQELNLADQLTVEENIFLGRERRRGLFLNKQTMRQLAAEALATLEADIDPTARVQDLNTSNQQMVEIAKAVSRRLRVLIMDEPTAALTDSETQVLFALIKRLRDQGVAILYISHKLYEISQLADVVTILRDGRLVASEKATALSRDEMATLMVGREISEMYPPKTEKPSADDIVLEARDIKVPGAVQTASFTLRRGEVLGFGGVVGSGRTALMEGLLGLRPGITGAFRVNGVETRMRNLADAVAHGITYLTEDRKGKGLVLNMGLRPNLTLLNLRAYCQPLISRRREQAAFQSAAETFDIRQQSELQDAGELSGGNQQKLLLAKAMSIEPDIVIINEPTRGIDVGTKQQIYQFIHTLSEQGKSVILISSEMPELIGLSHRMAVMCAGVLAGVLEGDDINEQEIMRYASGIKGKGAAGHVSS